MSDHFNIAHFILLKVTRRLQLYAAKQLLWSQCRKFLWSMTHFFAIDVFLRIATFSYYLDIFLIILDIASAAQ